MNWPIENRAEDNQVDYFYLRRRVAKYLHGNYDIATMDDEQQEEIKEVINLGYMQYCFPPILPPEVAAGTSYAHEWSFMRPKWEFETVADQRRYDLPRDWERPIGDLCYVNTNSNQYVPIKFTSASRLRSIEYQTDYSTYPEWAALEIIESVGAEPQTQVLVLHPTPDSTYQLAIQYQSHSKRLTEDEPYPVGGQLHGPGILASVMSAAEHHKNNAHGHLHDAFIRVLASNVVRDQERGATLLGYNGNHQDEIWGRGQLRQKGGLYYNDVTYNGSTYSG